MKDPIFKKPRNGIIMGIIFIIFGIAIILPTINHIKTHRVKNSNYFETKGEIVDYTSEGSSDHYSYVVEYEVDGKTYTIVSSPIFFKKKIGSNVGIKYNPDNPEDAIFENENSLITLPGGIIVFIACGAYSIYDSIKRLKNNIK
ncbi:MAG: DUF3592 domain-containing protein [Tenericutes bacterium]|nr:DUF3592 domain-containing protein [Bacilli bacterium]MDD3995490.1 DUF3592 domain-containing protein [Bacilli bacterium]NLV90729.1 DUF3592 domain-containing protein [Mycoplasmatota bacterium]